MSSDWQTTTLGEIVSFKTGKLDSNASENEGEYPFFTCSPMTLKINSFAFDTEAVILAGNNANGVFSVKHYSGKFNAYQRTYVIEPINSNDVSCKYIYFAVSHMVNHLQELAIGTSTKFLTKTILNALSVRMPSKIEQDKISGLLGALDDRITLLRETNSTLEAIAQAMFKSWFVDFDPVHAKQQGRAPEGMDEATAALFPDSFEESELGLVPRGWSINSVEDFAEKVGMGPFGSNIKVSTFVAQGVPVISGQHLRNTLMEDLSFNFITDSHAEKLKNSCVYAGDVIFTHAGNIGQVALIHSDALYEKYVLSQRQFFLRCNKQKMLPIWITYFFKSLHGQHLLLANASQVGVPSIARPVSYLRSIKLVVPPISIVSRFAEIVDSLLKQEIANKVIIQTISTLRDTLLPRLISGQLRLPEAETLTKESH